MKKVLFLYLLCSMMNFTASADIKDPSKRFYVVNTDQNKIIVADYDTYQKMKEQKIQDKFATVRDQLGKELPNAIPIVESIEQILQITDAVVTFIDDEESHVQLRMNNKKETCQILTSKMFNSDRFLKRFGKIVSWYVPEIESDLKKMKALEGSFVSLIKKVKKEIDKNIQTADLVLEIATGEKKIASTIMSSTKKEVAKSAMIAADKILEQQTGSKGMVPEMQGLFSELKTVLPSRTNKAQKSQEKAQENSQKQLLKPAEPLLKSLPAAIQKKEVVSFLTEITAKTEELYLFEYNNSVFLTTDKKRAEAGVRKRDTKELELTLMPTPSKRQFKKENIFIAKQALQRISKELDILVYHSKNKIAKMKYRKEDGVKKILYFNKMHRNIIKNKFGTAIRYLINLNSDTKAFEAILFKA